jgi:hypothetical protein
MVTMPVARFESFQHFGASYLTHRYRLLFVALVFTFVAFPILSAFHLRGALTEAVLAATLILASLPITSGRSRSLMLAGMAVVWVGRPIIVWLGHPLVSAMSLCAWTVIGLLAAASAIRYAMTGERIDGEHICAALGAYLLAGIYFGLLYWVLEQVVPESFSTPTDFSRTGAFYFSFVTLATLGYGDIVPRTDIARGIVIIEAVGGQLFLAVLVARLVSLYSTPTKH